MRPSHQAFVHRIRSVAGGAWILGLFAVAGCGEGKIPLYPVTGKVLVDGQPAAGAMVIFCPIEGSEELMRERPLGIAGADGTFLLTTFLKDDGAPAGQYKVIAQWTTNSTSADPRRAGRGGGGVDRLRGKYFNLDRTPFTATIEEGTNELAPFELSSR
jgi:hypothetical protein